MNRRPAFVGGGIGLACLLLAGCELAPPEKFHYLNSTPPGGETNGPSPLGVTEAYEDQPQVRQVGGPAAAGTGAPAAPAETPVGTGQGPGLSSPPPGTAAPLPSAQGTEHYVQRGDTLSGLSRRYGVPVESIRQANRLPNDVIRVGDWVRIPPQ